MYNTRLFTSMFFFTALWTVMHLLRSRVEGKFWAKELKKRCLIPPAAGVKYKISPILVQVSPEREWIQMANYLMVPSHEPETWAMCQALNPEAEEKHHWREGGKQPFSKWHFVTQWYTNKDTANEHAKLKINKIVLLMILGTIKQLQQRARKELNAQLTKKL